MFSDSPCTMVLSFLTSEQGNFPMEGEVKMEKACDGYKKRSMPAFALAFKVSWEAETYKLRNEFLACQSCSMRNSSHAGGYGPVPGRYRKPG